MENMNYVADQEKSALGNADLAELVTTLAEANVLLVENQNRMMNDLRVLKEAVGLISEGQRDIMNVLPDYMEASTYWQNTQSSIMQMFYTRMMSYMQNDRLLRSNLDWEQVSLYRFIRQIHETIPLYDAVAEVGKDAAPAFSRIGGNNDGGYVMLKPCSDTPIAYSLGIGDNVTWDSQMAADGYQVFQYDHTIDALPEENPAFHWKKMGIAAVSDPKNHLDTMENLMRENGHSNVKGMTLKMDIEDAEWDVLDAISEDVLNQFDQISLEFHHFLTRRDREQTIRCMEKLSRSFAMVHAHWNNSVTVRVFFCGEYMMPDLMEATFVRKDKYQLKKSTKFLPIEFDEPCRSYLTDLFLGYWNK